MRRVDDGSLMFHSCDDEVGCWVGYTNHDECDSAQAMSPERDDGFHKEEER